MRNEERQDGGWHLKREVQLGHIITTCTVLFSVIWYAGKLEQRIALVEQSQMQVTLAQKERDDRQDKLASDALAMLRQQLDRLEQKLDWVIGGRK